MTSPEFAAIILAAGYGTRMKSDRPKVMHEIAHRSMIGHVVASVAPLSPKRTALVVGPDMGVVLEAARRAAPQLPIGAVEQRDRKGTGHAVAQARAALSGIGGDVAILYGDVPLLQTATIARALAARRDGGHAATVIGMRPDDAGAYGRLIVGPDGLLERIVEAADADAATRAVGLCNSGLMVVDGRLLFSLIDRLTADNAKGEYYLTDIIAHARAAGRSCSAVEASAEELTGVNSRAELAAAEHVLQSRLRAAVMTGGATLTDPGSVWLSFDTVIGRDVLIGPAVSFGPGVTVGDGARIGPFCHLEGVRIEAGAVVAAGTRSGA